MRAVWLRGLSSVVVVLLASAACGGAGPAPSPTPDPLAGRFKAFGGGGAMPQVTALAKRFSELHPGVVLELSDVGSDSSIALAKAGEIDVGFISREPKAAEKGTVETLSIGATGTAVVLNANNPVGALTKDQVKKIFSGEIADWGQVPGGKPGAIRAFVREKDSATRSNFESYFFDGKATYSKDVVEIFEKAETLKAIASFENAIGMATLGADVIADKSVKLPSIDGVAATKENLNSGAWKIRRPLYLVYNTDPTKVKPAIKAFLDFVKGPEGQKILAGL